MSNLRSYAIRKWNLTFRHRNNISFAIRLIALKFSNIKNLVNYQPRSLIKGYEIYFQNIDDYYSSIFVFVFLFIVTQFASFSYSIKLHHKYHHELISNVCSINHCLRSPQDISNKNELHTCKLYDCNQQLSIWIFDTLGIF